MKEGKEDVEMTDVEMTDVKKGEGGEKGKEKSEYEIERMVYCDLKKQAALISRAVSEMESRLFGRVLRTVNSCRKIMSGGALLLAIEDLVKEGEMRSFLNDFLIHYNIKEKPIAIVDVIMDDVIIKDDSTDHPKKTQKEIEKEKKEKKEKEEKEKKEKEEKEKKEEEDKRAMEIIETKIERGVEVDCFVHLLVGIFLIDEKKIESARTCFSFLLDKLVDLGLRTLNPLSCRAYFFYSRCYELLGRLDEIRDRLHGLHRTACLRHNYEGQIMLLNLLLRNYLNYNLYDQADKLLKMTKFREDVASSNQFARYLYYKGRIKSIQLDYTDAYDCLWGAIRKSPQEGAKGFRIEAHKLACIVQLLMGEIPERSIFQQPGMRLALAPYFELTQAVRLGDLESFQNVVEKHMDLFRREKNSTLILRLRHNVIKTGLRKINLAYSRIGFEDVAQKLHLESSNDAEFVVAKAIKDGVINATLDHAGQFMRSKENADTYRTTEPQSVFDQRIKFCLNIHNEAVKAMRFPPENQHSKNLETAQQRRQREAEIASIFDDDADF